MKKEGSAISDDTVSEAMFFEAKVQGMPPVAGTLPQSLGLETKGGIFTPLITRGTLVPARYTAAFTTADDGQPGIQIRVFQGKHRKAAKNTLLGIFEVNGFAPQPRGVPDIRVSFDVDARGVLRVSARDDRAGRELPVAVSGASRGLD